jgi:hypothetical protein
MEKAKEGQVHMRVGNRREHMTKRESNQALGSQDLILVFKLNQSPSHSHAPPHERALFGHVAGTSVRTRTSAFNESGQA